MSATGIVFLALSVVMLGLGFYGASVDVVSATGLAESIGQMKNFYFLLGGLILFIVLYRLALGKASLRVQHVMSTTIRYVILIGVVLGIKGEAKGYVTLVLSDKLRTLLKMIPLPRKMSKTPDQVEEFNVYAYVKQLIDGNDVSVLLGVADEVVKVMDTLKFYIPTLKDMSMGLKLSLELIRRYLPEGAFSRIYLDEQPVDSGSYIAGAVALESGDLNTAGVAMFKIKPKTEGVRLYWAEDLPAGMTLAEAEAHNVGALLESDGVVVDNAKVTCTYKKKGLFSSKSTEFPTQPGIYTQTATVSGNYSCEKITRTIVIN